MRAILAVLLICAAPVLGCEPGEIEHHCKSPYTCPLPEPRPAEEPPLDDGGVPQEDAGEEG